MIRAEQVTKSFSTGILGKNNFLAVKNVTLDISRGETVGLIGESGCGKSTLAKLLLGLLPVTEGRIILYEKDLALLNSKELRQLRLKMQIMFQHPESSLNPRIKLFDSIAEPARIHRLVDKGSSQERVLVQELMDLVGLRPEHLNRYPVELSGGQIQRGVLARVLSLKPEFLIVDEPTSMLDVSVQAQILNLLKVVQKSFNMACLFISHDLDVIKCMSDRVVIMRAGEVVETGLTPEVLANPKHPYTRELVSAFFNKYEIYNLAASSRIDCKKIV